MNPNTQQGSHGDLKNPGTRKYEVSHSQINFPQLASAQHAQRGISIYPSLACGVVDFSFRRSRFVHQLSTNEPQMLSSTSQFYKDNQLFVWDFH